MTTQERNSLAIQYEPLVRRVVQFLRLRVPRCWEAEDLRSWGMIALLRALDEYEPQSGQQIEPYLWCKVRFGILDSLREVHHSRRVGDQPHFERLHVELRLRDTSAPDPVREILAREAWDAIHQLRPQWRDVMRLYYQGERTMQECGRLMGVTEGRVSQIHKTVLRKLRRTLAA
jgi:RNA polymerase sigma factor (sigma-70 family)